MPIHQNNKKNNTAKVVDVCEGNGTFSQRLRRQAAEAAATKPLAGLTSKNHKKHKSKSYKVSTHFLLQGINRNGECNPVKIDWMENSLMIESKIGYATRGNYMLEYTRLLKEARVWGAQGQSKLSMEAERRAKCLLAGNVDDYRRQTHSEQLFVRTKKF